jgi:hypothetical protein
MSEVNIVWCPKIKIASVGIKGVNSVKIHYSIDGKVMEVIYVGYCTQRNWYVFRSLSDSLVYYWAGIVYLVQIDLC